VTAETEASVEEYTAQALKFLAQSETEFAAGDTRQGSEKLYGAASQAVIAAAKQRGWRYRSHRDNKNATTRLATELNDDLLLAGFLAAEKFHINFHHGGMEDYEIAQDRPVVRRYVHRMVDLINEYDMNGRNGQHG
jgi:hypothetical protein